MRKAVLFGPRDLRVVEVPVPVPATGQVAVRVVRSSPYGTDVELYKAYDDRHRVPYPVGLGADFAGVIESVGPGVRGFAPGDRVIAAALYHCGECRFCRAGKDNLCLANMSTNDSRQECFQDVTLVWSNKLAKLPDSVSFDQGAIIVGLMMGLNIFEKAVPQPGETVAVIGLGAMGLPQVALAKHLGARVIAIGQGSAGRAIAHAYGADLVFDNEQLGDRLLDQVRVVTPEGADCVIETTTSDWGVRLSLDMAGMSSRIAWIGGSPITINPWALVAREITIGGIRAGRHQRQAIDLVASGAIDLTPMITDRITLDELPAAFERLAGPDRGAVGRIVVEHDRRVKSEE